MAVLLTKAVVTAGPVLAPPPLNDVRTVVVLICSVHASPSVLLCMEETVLLLSIYCVPSNLISITWLLAV